MSFAILDGKADRSEEKDKIDYAAGMVMALSLKDVGFERISYDDFVEGMKAAFHESLPKIPPQKAVDMFNHYIMLLREELKEKNKIAGEEFLTKNGTREKVNTLASGVQYEILRPAPADAPAPDGTDSVRMQYEATLIDGTVFDSTMDTGAQVFKLSELIIGLQEALSYMGVGARWKVYIPAEFAYGEKGASPMIQPNSALIFSVELLEVLPATE